MPEKAELYEGKHEKWGRKFWTVSCLTLKVSVKSFDVMLIFSQSKWDISWARSWTGDRPMRGLECVVWPIRSQTHATCPCQWPIQSYQDTWPGQGLLQCPRQEWNLSIATLWQLIIQGDYFSFLSLKPPKIFGALTINKLFLHIWFHFSISWKMSFISLQGPTLAMFSLSWKVHLWNISKFLGVVFSKFWHIWVIAAN